ncbi:hypothetical protein HUG17_10185 [Dermatophagoides farinae]|uniref:Uncharacterized protein n=1 Tax=Dermatophagoides farinae TaxID=6954 RepID=A0A9D4NR07_DERFA|nr:uncharacterized protein LOC124498274 [Dermatophagoides farinae]KAH7636215.1 hypothetical protein HUG17_10185 [Dermatophagoides farinae]
MVKTLIVDTTAAHLNKIKRRQRQKFFYKIACLIYVIIVIVLMMFLITRAFKYKFDEKYTKCHQSYWIDTVISILTMVIIVIASGIMMASSNYVFAKPPPPPPIERLSSVNATEDFIRRNSSVDQNRMNSDVKITKNPSVGSDCWLTAVRNDAYENQRRKSSSFNPNLLHV